MTGFLELILQIHGSRVQRRAASAYWVLANRALRAQQDASDRAELDRAYLGRLIQPNIEKRDEKWFAIIEGGPSVPRVEACP